PLSPIIDRQDGPSDTRFSAQTLPLQGISFWIHPFQYNVRIPQAPLHGASCVSSTRKPQKERGNSRRPRKKAADQELVVGAPRFELGTSCAQGRRATRLRYAPTSSALLILKHFLTLLQSELLPIRPSWRAPLKVRHFNDSLCKNKSRKVKPNRLRY